MSDVWLHWCRLCAGSQDVCVSLCDEEGNSSNSIIEKANKYLKLNISSEVEKSDCLPQQICNSCAAYLQKIDSYATQCARVQDMFYNLSLETGGDKIYLIKHRFLNNTKDQMADDQNSNNEDYRVTCSFEVKSYETVPVNENEDSKSGKGPDLYKITENTCIPRRGRRRNRDKVVPRIKLRAVRPPVRSKTIEKDPLALSDEEEEKSSLPVGAARRKSKQPKNIQSKKKCNNVDVVEGGNAENVSLVANDKEKTANETNAKRLRKSELKLKIPSLFNFQCHICTCVSKNWNALRNHCKDVHRKSAQITCDCGKILSSRTAILEHLARHTQTNLFSCDKCEKTFHRKSLLNIHMTSHLPKEEQPYVCCKCARRFHCEALLRNHERTHLPKEERLTFPCDLCKKMFTSKSSVSAHQKAVHHGERPFVCDQCGHCFTSKGILQEHLTIHSDESPWNCTKCSKSFKTKYRLKIHMDTHRETPYQCPKCPVQLSTRRTLRMHLVVHRDTKAYQCSTCGKAFRRAKDLKNHSNLHTGRRPYTCPFCSRTFANGSNCRSHKLRMHREELRMYESAVNQTIEPINFVSAVIESNPNDNTSNNIDGKEDEAVMNLTLSDEPTEPSEQRKADNSTTEMSNTDYPFHTFAVATDARQFSPQVRQPPSILRNSLSKHFTLDHQYYSPNHDQDISSAAVPAFPGIPYMHHQPVVFNRSVDRS